MIIDTAHPQIASFDAIDDLQFPMLKQKLQQPYEGESWSLQKCDEVEHKYKMFLKLIFLYPKKQIVPDQEIDTYWHYHILDTKAYYDDTMAIFGRFIHHFPYFGLNGEADKAKLQACFSDTKLLFLEHFQYSLNNTNADCSNEGSGDSSCASSCRY